MTLEEIADRLYALPPEDFTAARADEAKAAGKPLGKQVAALRRPTVSAWIVNALARAEPRMLEQLLALGPALAEAQRGQNKDQLVSLGEQRRRLVGAVTRRAFEVSGRAPLGSALGEVEATLEAALADPSSADAVRSGRLVRPLSYAGFGEVDVTGAVAAPVKGKATPTPKPAPPRKDVAAAEKRALEAAGALDDAVRACEQAHRAQDAAAADLEAAEASQSAAEQALTAARTARVEAEEAARKQARATGRAEQAVRDAQRLAEKTRKALDDLRRG